MKLPNPWKIAAAVAVALMMCPSAARASASLKGSRVLQGNDDGNVVLKSTVAAELASAKYGHLQFLTFPESPEDLVVHYKTTSGQFDVLNELLIRTPTPSSTGPVQMTPVRLFELYAELAGLKVEVPKALRAAVDFVISHPANDVQPDVKLPELPDFVPNENRDLESHQRQLDGTDAWFEDYYCSYREAPNPGVCRCFTDVGVLGDYGAFLSRSRRGLLQTAYNFYGGSFRHRLEKCVPNGSSGQCTFQTIMDDSSVLKYELSRVWHFSYGPEILYRTTVYDAENDSFHLSVSELNFYLYPGGCMTNGHGCYTCPNVI